MMIAHKTPKGKLGKGKRYSLMQVTHGSIGVSTGKGMSVTLTDEDRVLYVTISASEFALMREWFQKNGCEE
jgi:hypothetical protein